MVDDKSDNSSGAGGYPYGSLHQFGDPSSRSGAIYMFHDDLGAARALAQYVALTLRMRGIDVDQGELEAFAQRKAAEHHERIRSQGVPKHVRRFLEAPGKKEKTKRAAELKMTGSDLERLVVCCGDLGLTHQRKNREFVPEQLRLREEDWPSGKGADARTFTTKVLATFEQRKNVTAHLFESRTSKVWHCFYMSLRDAFSDRRGRPNHWVGGEHLHYVGHDFGGRISKELVWSALDARDVRLPNFHIRFGVKS